MWDIEKESELRLLLHCIHKKGNAYYPSYSETCIKRTPSINRTVAEVPQFISLIYFK